MEIISSFLFSSLVTILTFLLHIEVNGKTLPYSIPTLADGEPDPNIIFPMVSTPLGQLRGQTLYSRSGKPYYAYRGIPYAQPPSRFQASVPVQPWGGLLDARTDGAICAQPSLEGVVMGEENCLFLNIFFPHHDRCQDVSESGKLPVYLHIHGGAYIAGSGSFKGSKYLLDECIVFVTINYRLGALGFLTTGDDIIPGNLGLKDQIVALNWVKNYISYFRGDSNIVNINGISAGGSSVSHLITSPAAKGLFSSAIASSGCVLNPFSIQENPLRYANNFGQKLGCSTTTSQDLKSCLESISLSDIVQAHDNGMIIEFAPTIEPITASAPFQTENPAILLQNGDFNRVPLLTGFTEDEGLTLHAGVILADAVMTSQLNNSWFELAPALLYYDDLGLDQMDKDRISSEIRQFYFGTNDIGQNTRKALIDLFSDRIFVQGIFETVELHSKFAPVYSFVNTYKGGSSSAINLGYEIPVIGHAEDSQYFYSSNLPEFNYGTEQYEFSTRLVKYWTNFAKTGHPFTEGGATGWNATTGDAYHQLDLIEGEFFSYLGERQKFWRNVGLYEYELNANGGSKYPH